MEIQSWQITQRDVIPCGALGGAPGHKILCPYFFDSRKQPSFNLHDLSWVPMGRFDLLLIREGRGCEIREKQSRVALGQCPVSPSTIHTTISLSYFADSETSCRWEKLWYAALKHVDPRLVGLEGLWCWLLLTSPPTFRRMYTSWSHPLLL